LRASWPPSGAGPPRRGSPRLEAGEAAGGGTTRSVKVSGGASEGLLSTETPGLGLALEHRAFHSVTCTHPGESQDSLFGCVWFSSVFARQPAAGRTTHQAVFDAPNEPGGSVI